MSDDLDNIMTFDTGADGIGPGDLHPVELHASEGISRLYSVEVVLDCLIDGGIAPDVAEGMFSATSLITFGPGGAHSLAGVVRDWELLGMEMSGARSQYRATLVPRFWLTTLTRRSRCFNELAFPDIVETVLQETGLVAGDDYELRLNETYPVSEYVVQYEESDFDFLSRWMERLGIFYFFEQIDGRDKLVLADANAQLVAVPDHPSCLYSDLAVSEKLTAGAVHGLGRLQRKQPSLAFVRDFNWRGPDSLVQGRFEIDGRHGTGLQAFYGEHFKDDAEGETRARIRAESQACRKTEYQGASANADFAPGFRLSVTGSPLGEMDLEYVIVDVDHVSVIASAGGAVGTYSNRFRMIPVSTPFRAPFFTPWPRIDGVMHARIDAESVSSAAPVDAQGRYRVVIPYDLYAGYGGSATRWVRKAEPYSGSGYGMHFTLHVGAEVLLAHVGGDPDRPMIIGTVPNPSAASPLTQTDATRSAIRTRSGILIDFEDDA